LIMATVIGVVGCTGTGKSTLCDALEKQLKERERVVCVIHTDDYFREEEGCPTLDLESLNWAGGTVPDALSSKTRDTNCPEAVEWDGVRAAVSQAAATAGQGVVLVEGFLVLCDGPVREMLDAVVMLEFKGGRDAEEEVIRRKWTRRHLGKLSYEERGVSFADYCVYWDGYVHLRFTEYAAKGTPPPGKPVVSLDALLPPPELAVQVQQRLSL